MLDLVFDVDSIDTLQLLHEFVPRWGQHLDHLLLSTLADAMLSKAKASNKIKQVPALQSLDEELKMTDSCDPLAQSGRCCHYSLFLNYRSLNQFQ
jgi:hypothetical protein